jgi:polysaccharide lyase-like protein
MTMVRPRGPIGALVGVAAVTGLLLVFVEGGAAGAVSSQHHHHQHRHHHHHRAGGDHGDRDGTPPSTSSSGAASSAPMTSPATAPSSTPVTAANGDLASFLGPAFVGPAFCSFAHQNAAVSGGVLTVRYPPGSSAPSAGAPYGGAQLCEGFASGPRTEAVLTYRLRFPVGFQFVKGGKLPGLYGGVEPFSGGGHNPDGWSMRLMWRTGGAGEVYGYISTTTGYGNDWGRGNFRWLADGNWHTVGERVHLNTPGHADGWVALSYDGVTVVDQGGLAITTSGTPISGVFFSTFYGGHDASWSPTVSQHLDFAGFTAG